MKLTAMTNLVMNSVAQNTFEKLIFAYSLKKFPLVIEPRGSQKVSTHSCPELGESSPHLAIMFF
jgi:hypothetical protein